MKFLLELKTTSDDISPGSTYWKRLTLDNQISMYLAAVRELGHDVSGVVYDCVRKTGLRQGQNETAESYESRIVAQIGEDPDRYYQRGIIVRTGDELDEHDADIWQTAELIYAARVKGRWPRYVGSCTLYNTVCDYFDVCTGATTIDSDNYRTAGVMTGGLPVLSSSAVTTWRQCPRKYYYAYELRRRKVGEVSRPLLFGRLFHKLVEIYQSKGLSTALDGCVDPHARALLRGYHARWADSPYRTVATEQPFTRPLRDPETGAVSKEWQLGGVVDAVVEEK